MMQKTTILLLVALLSALSLPAADSISLAAGLSWKTHRVADAKRGDQGAANGWEAADFDDSAWATVDPTAGFHDQGVVWYRTRLTLPADWAGQTAILQLGWPDDGAEAYINGVSVGKTSGDSRMIAEPVPADLLRTGDGAANVIAVRVWNWHQSGGLRTGPLALSLDRPLQQSAANGPAWTQQLNTTVDLTDGVLKEGRWEHGYRDEGTSDTRPNLKRLPDAYQGQDALLMDVWYPNSKEMVDYILQPGESGSELAAHGAAYLAFRYRTETLNGDMAIRLNEGRLRWKSRVRSYVAQFPVRPTGEWEEVILPLAAFAIYNNRGEVDHTLADLGATEVLSIGYDNHRLQSPGEIAFTDFRVGAMPTVQPSEQPVSLAGLWRFRLDHKRPDGSRSDFSKKGDAPANERDREGYGLEAGWMKPDFDDSDWAAIAVPASWETQGYNYDGPAWYRGRVLVPAHWEGRPLKLQLGRPDDRGTLWWNGDQVQHVTKFGPRYEVVLQPEQIRYGQVNDIATVIYDWYRGGGLNSGKFVLAPVDQTPRATVTLAWTDDPASEAAPSAFEMGAKVPARGITVYATFAAEGAMAPGTVVAYELVDCFHRHIAEGRQATVAADGTIRAAIALDAAQTRQLYYGEWFDARLTLIAPDGQVLDAHCPRDLRLQYAERDALALPALPARVDSTPYGDLPLVDVIDCAADDADTPHPYKEGGIRASWVSTRAYATWEDGVTIGQLGDTRFREANNNEFFGYRVGRGQLKPHTAYLLRLRVPDDKARYSVIDIQAGRNYQGTGYRASTSPTDPWGDYPQTGEMQWYDHLVFVDETTYGFEGSRKASSAHGFWVFFHDNGRVYTGAHEAGPAVAEIRLYEIPDIAAHYPTIRYPEGLPQRTLMMDWERQPEAPPVDTARYAKFLGLNVIAPVFQKWSSHAFWHSETGYAPPGWYRVLSEDEDDRDVYEMWLDGTRQEQIGFMPRIEYGGGPKLTKDARVIAPNGKVDPTGRYSRWGANILHEATWTELETVVDELIGRHIADNPQLVGLLWRQRQDRIKPSYGAADIALFAEETGITPPDGSASGQATWILENAADDYHAWWQAKRADFLRQLRDKLKTYRSDLVLAYYNWDQDGWRLGANKNQMNSAKDWSDLYNVDKAGDYWRRVYTKMSSTPPDEYVTMLQRGPQNQQIYPELFSAKHDAAYQRRAIESANALDPTLQVEAMAADLRGTEGDIIVFAPINGRYLADNEAYVNYFRTADGLAICNMFDYEEKARWNIQGDRYEASEMTPGGKDYAMAEEVLAFFHGDPNVITWTTYTYGRGWIDEHRRFAQAFLALPDSRGEILTAAASPASDDLRVRLYRHDPRHYLSVTHRGTETSTFELRLPVAGGTVTDLVSGETIPSRVDGGDLVFTVTVGPMELNSYRIEP